jgi:hypothetical protein
MERPKFTVIGVDVCSMPTCTQQVKVVRVEFSDGSSTVECRFCRSCDGLRGAA